MVWCGEDAVLLYWKKVGVIMIGPYGSWLKFPYEEAVYLAPERDCCRIYSSCCHELIRRVPTSIEEIQRIGSTSSSALLYDAMEAFDAGEVRGDENIRAVQEKGKLDKAIKQCLQAAGQCFSPLLQRNLLRAASYGKSFCEDFDTEYYVDMCRKIRVLNNIRHSSIGLSCTLTQYQELTERVLLSRLMHQHEHLLAYKIGQYLHLNTDSILVHWACQKVKYASQTLSDEELMNTLQQKLQHSRLISYAEIARCAEAMDKHSLATSLLELEEIPSDQIPLLLSMGEFELALRKALQAAETNLIYMCLLYMQSMLSSSKELLYILHRDPSYQEAIALMISYLRQTKASFSSIQPFLMDVNEHATIALGDQAIRQVYLTSHVNERVRFYEQAKEFYQEAKATMHVKMTEEQLELVHFQQQIEEEYQLSCRNLSLMETISFLCRSSKRHAALLTRVQELSKLFKLSEKRLYHCKIQAFAQSSQWKALQQLSNEKRIPPCGFKVFALTCFDHQQRQLAEEYAARITANEEKFDTFLYMECYQEALEVAMKLKDPNKLSAVRNQSSDPMVHKHVDEAAQALGFV